MRQKRGQKLTNLFLSLLTISKKVRIRPDEVNTTLLVHKNTLSRFILPTRLDKTDMIRTGTNQGVDMKLPETGFLRLKDIIGDPEKGVKGLIPVSRTTWWRGVKEGIYPKPVKISSRTTAWRVEDVRELIKKLGNGDTDT